jgi:hypothetical protein
MMKCSSYSCILYLVMHCISSNVITVLHDEMILHIETFYETYEFTSLFLYMIVLMCYNLTKWWTYT